MRYLYAVLAVALFASGCVAHSAASTTADVARASFNADGSATLPVGYRAWWHVGTRYKSPGINILDGLPTKGPEILNAYVEPSAMKVYARTGQWPEGTQIVKEFSSVKTGEGCDEKTFNCTTRLGAGIFEDGYVGLGMMVKDSARFPDAPGHWGYFTFGHKRPPYDATAKVSGLDSCSSCHVRLASDTDYVISAAHIGLAKQMAQ